MAGKSDLAWMFGALMLPCVTTGNEDGTYAHTWRMEPLDYSRLTVPIPVRPAYFGTRIYKVPVKK